MSQIAVIGSGAWGLALASHLARMNHDVLVWCHAEEVADQLRESGVFAGFPDVVLPSSIRYTADLQEVAADQDLLIFAVASPFTRSTAKRIAPYIREGQRITAVTKGVEDGTYATQVEIIRQEIPCAAVSALSGPTHAEEVVRSLPTTIVSASEDPEFAAFVQDLFMNEFLRVYTSTDVTGVELGGSLKNVIALAAGIADGIGYGDNLKAALITRGIHEICGLAVKLGARYETLWGLSGMGDLIVTCASMHSRNRRAGILIGQGKTMEEAMAEVGQVVEGVYSAKAAVGLAERCGVELPISREVNRVLFEHKDPQQAVRDLLLRERKAE